MPDAEFALKMNPIVFADQHFDNYELLPLFDTTDAIVTEDGQPVIQFEPDHYTNPRLMDNKAFRKKMSNMVWCDGW